jgi:thiamine biosynthesis lipoprotein
VIRFPAMGTTVAFQAVGVPPAAAEAAARDLVEQIEAQLSRFRPDSDISRLSRSAGAWIPVGEHTLAVLTAAIELRSATEGLFDPTAGAGPAPQPRPGAAGSPGLVEVDLAAGRARVDRPVDLGAIGKGYAADQLIELARGLGAVAGFASVGVSSVSVFGRRPAGGPWRIGLRSPGEGANVSFGTINLTEGALATSGFDQQGRHIRDPRTGRPAHSEVLQVTVTAATGLVAEAYSTAIAVGGVSLAARLCEPSEAGCVLVTAESVLVSANLRAAFTPGPQPPPKQDASTEERSNGGVFGGIGSL